MAFSPKLLFFAFISAAAAQVNTGSAFNFVPGTGACGFTNSSSQNVASVSVAFFDSFPGATANPNDNPICQHSLLIASGGKSVVAQVVDDFISTGFGPFDIGLSTSAFSVFADPSVGVIHNVTWTVI